MTTCAGATPNCTEPTAIGAATRLTEIAMSPINNRPSSSCFAAGTGACSLLTECAQQHLLAQQPMWHASPTGALATGQTDAGSRVVVVKTATTNKSAAAIRFTSKNIAPIDDMQEG